MIHLDSNSETPPCSAALEKFASQGQSRSEIEQRTQSLYDWVGADPKDLFSFTSSGAEAITQVYWSVFIERARKEGKCHIITSCIEDAPTMQNCKRLEELGCYIKIAPVKPSGQIDVEKLAELINPRTALISVTMAHGLTGVIQPYEEIALLAKAKNVLLHLEATHAMGKLFFSFTELGVDYLTFSGDRIHSVKSSGGLFAKKGAPVLPLILGGSVDTSSLMALATAALQSSLYLDSMTLEVARMRDLLETTLVRLIPGTQVAFAETLRLPNTTTLIFPRVHQEALLYLLNRKKLSATIGGVYCQHLSRVLAASHIENPENSLSFSLSRMTTEEEILKASSLIAEAVHSLQAISEDIVL